MGRIFRKIRLLVWKNFVLQIRRPIGTAVEILLPVAFIALLILARTGIKENKKCFSSQPPYFPSSPAAIIEYKMLAQKSNGIKFENESLKLLYWPINNNTARLLQAASTNLNLDLATNDSNGNVFKSEQDVLTEAKEHQEYVLGAVIFQNVNDDQPLPKKIEYSIRLLHSTANLYTQQRSWMTKWIYPFFIPAGPRLKSFYKSPFLALQYYIDTGIIQAQTNNKTYQAVEILQQFPYPDYIEDLFYTIIKTTMPLVIVLAFEYTAVTIIKELVAEKESRLKESMKMMGLANWLHWLSWFIKNFLFWLCTIILLTILLKGGKVFPNSNGLFIFVFLLLYILASIATLFFVSVLFSNAVRGMLFGALLWFASLAPYLSFSDDQSFKTLSRAGKTGSCVLPNTCLGIIVQLISQWEAGKVGVQFNNLNSYFTVDDNFTIGQAFGMLIFDCFFYGILTWYIENVFPGEFGVPRPFYFPFQCSYWCGSNHTKNFAQNQIDSKLVHSENCEEEPVGLEIGVCIKELRKVYKGATGDKVAVDRLSLNMYKGQITCLLGHNGAGKTTTMSILTGLYTPTSGTATINGKSIFKEMDRIRDSLGLCPQHNVLFDRLTVREHLEFFTGLKGISKDKARTEIDQMLLDIQLHDKANQQSSTLSGGMKRKLNCAIALIGGSETVFLDEPTSGMDPYARRATWDLLQKYRKNKTVILTTHFMDEADYLADRIAIMAEGKLKCCGSSLFLKKRYGVGYHLTLVKGNNFKETKTKSLFAEKIPTSKLVSNIGAEISYILDEENSKHFKGLFSVLEEQQQDYGISSFGVSVTTLEEVFLKVAESESSEPEDVVLKSEENLQLQYNVNKLESNSQIKLNGGLKRYLIQFQAMFIKRLLHSIREKKAVFTQIILPLLLVLIGLLLVTSSKNTQTDDPLLKLDLSMLKDRSSSLVAYFADYTFTPELKMMSLNYYKPIGVDLQDITIQSAQISLSNQVNNVNLLYTSPTFSGNNDEACCQFKYFVLNQGCQNKILANADLKTKCLALKNTFGYSSCPQCVEINSTFCENSTPELSRINLNDKNVYYQEYILEDSGKKLYDYFQKYVAGFSASNKKYSVWYSNQGWHTIAAAFSSGSNILLKFFTNSSDYGIVTNNFPLPRNTLEQIELTARNGSNLSLVIFIAMACSFIAASFITFIVNERTSKAKHIQFVSGVNSICYWLGTFCWDFINYLVPALGIIILFAAFNPSDYTGQLGAIVLILILFGLAVLPFTYLLGFLFTNSLIAYSVVALLLMVISLAMVIAIFVLRLIDEVPLADKLNLLFAVIPTYALPQAFSDISSNLGKKTACTVNSITERNCRANSIVYFDNVLTWSYPGIGYLCFYMFVEFVVYFTIVLLIEEGFFVGGLFKATATVSTIRDGEDEDVQAEKKRVDMMAYEDIKSHAVVVKDLSKVYHSNGMVAVDHLSFSIPKGECFGLLGVNGAGKTTTFGMLTGELSLSSGTAFLHGYNLQTQLKKVQQRIGYCPQFDALIGRMTGREMLRMFARLRGVPSNNLEEVVNAAIEQLNLSAWADKMCGDYSGGNKRKLSTAIAIVGDPAIVFLDEPTSGMDPVSRRFLWNTLIQKLNAGRSIVLTSHSMEECEALCTRLVIMVNGQFKCIGSIQHLKSRFGKGYSVMIKVMTDQTKQNGIAFSKNNPAYSSENNETIYDLDTVQLHGNQLEKTQRIKEFMENTFPGSMLIEDRQGLLQYQILNSDIRWSQMFGTLEENSARLGIIDYSVSQTSLEQVFINFAKYQHSEERAKRNVCCSCSCF
ncbi:phospholipid-transporting ATPase ABCA3 isoform X1 [Hydra vulgaris]|uniref:phospholipid-transporting ATPase ABCA3 isoform X1 n=1 Tax=Hydra vulgaris TaxID=6087 RepID=UPI001F5F676D|nr:phospholipid-transporting ATPase ABCA3 [Hydra vulgaris]